MAVFAYSSVDSLGKRVNGRLEAVNLIDLELRLRRIGLDLINADLADNTRRALFGSKRITRRDLITFCFDMEQISRSGIPILEGIRDLRDSIENPRFREILTTLTEDIAIAAPASTGDR